MTPEFLNAYTEALNRHTEILRKLQAKGILQVGIDDQLINDFNESQAEVKKYSDHLLRLHNLE